MTTKIPVLNTIDSPLSVGDREASRSEVEGGLGVRSMQFLKATAVSTEKAIEMMKLTKWQIELTMFAAGVGTLEGLALRLQGVSKG